MCDINENNREAINENMVINYTDENVPYYCRSTSYHNNQLRALLTNLYKCQYSILTPSGTAAITTILETCANNFIKKNKRII